MSVLVWDCHCGDLYVSKTGQGANPLREERTFNSSHQSIRPQ